MELIKRSENYSIELLIDNLIVKGTVVKSLSGTITVSLIVSEQDSEIGRYDYYKNLNNNQTRVNYTVSDINKSKIINVSELLVNEVLKSL